jgi:hypothetical protein
MFKNGTDAWPDVEARSCACTWTLLSRHRIQESKAFVKACVLVRRGKVNQLTKYIQVHVSSGPRKITTKVVRLCLYANMEKKTRLNAAGYLSHQERKWKVDQKGADLESDKFLGTIYMQQGREGWQTRIQCSLQVGVCRPRIIGRNWGLEIRLTV